MALDDQPEFLREATKIRETARKTEPAPPQPANANTSINISPQGWVQERTRVAVGHGVNVSGKLIFHEPVRIEGAFKGEVTSSDLVVIGEEGAVEGRVKAIRLVVLGELRGDIVGSARAYLGPHARVYGDIAAEHLTVCEGATFTGNVTMSGFRADAQNGTGG
jgi:cytoskeletal protein CcmA (bactofilin family)